MKTKEYISKEQSRMFKTFLNTQDIVNVAEETNLSHTTVYNISNGKYPMNVKTQKVLPLLNLAVYKKIVATRAYIDECFLELFNLDEVQEYIKNNMPNI